MKQLIQDASNKLVEGKTSEISVILPNTDEFNLYFNNAKLQAGALKQITLAIIDDKTRKDCDFVLTHKGLLLICKNKVNSLYNYQSVDYSHSKFISGNGWYRFGADSTCR